MSSDNENTMIGRHTGLVTRMIACAKNPVLRIWCALHQIDLVVKSAADQVGSRGACRRRDVCNLAGHRLMGVKAERDGNNMRLEKAMRHLCYSPS
ncbi:unnamed protein product [Sphagnum troendelagicum]